MSSWEEVRVWCGIVYICDLYTVHEWLIDNSTLGLLGKIAGYFANLQSDPNQLILGFEPIIVCEFQTTLLH